MGAQIDSSQDEEDPRTFCVDEWSHLWRKRLLKLNWTNFKANDCFWMVLGWIRNKEEQFFCSQFKSYLLNDQGDQEENKEKYLVFLWNFFSG